jgi:IS5 family transposase
MQQQTLAEITFEQHRKPTPRERFPSEMDRVMPWADLVATIEPVYPKADGPGRPPVGVERMLRLHCLQQWFNLSDPAIEEALYNSRAMRQFVGIDLGREPVPDETTICKFRHRLEAHQLGEQLFARNRGTFGQTRPPGQPWDDRGGHHYCRPQFDEESAEGAGSGDASDQEREAVVFG